MVLEGLRERLKVRREIRAREREADRLTKQIAERESRAIARKEYLKQQKIMAIERQRLKAKARMNKLRSSYKRKPISFDFGIKQGKVKKQPYFNAITGEMK